MQALSTAWCNGSTTVCGTVSEGSNPFVATIWGYGGTVDALVLGTSIERCVGSTPSIPTNFKDYIMRWTYNETQLINPDGNVDFQFFKEGHKDTLAALAKRLNEDLDAGKKQVSLIDEDKEPPKGCTFYSYSDFWECQKK